MTDRETLDKARAMFTGQTQGDLLAREVIAIAEQRESTIACEVEHSRRMEDQLKVLHGMLAPLKDAILFARSQRRPMGIGQDSEIGTPTVTIEVCPRYGRETDNPGFYLEADTLGPEDAEGPSATKRIALALLRLSYAVVEKVTPRP